MCGLDDVVDALSSMFVDPQYVTLARSLFPAEESALDIAVAVQAVCRKALCSDFLSCFYIELSVGAVFGVQLSDGRAAALKFHPPAADHDHLCAVAHVQGYLQQAGFPCPRILRPPHHDGTRTITFESWCTDGRTRQIVTAPVRGSMARVLALLVQGAARCPFHRNLKPDFLPQSLWPSPHNDLFDFNLTAAGAEWIDRRAELPRRVLDRAPSRLVPGHMDWSLQHFRFDEEDQVAVVFDWDSLRMAQEARIVGGAAATFTLRNDVESQPPTSEQARAFVSDYEAARCAPFTPEEWVTVSAAALYAACYGARCEHAVGTPRSSGRFGRRVESLPDRGYFSA